MPVRDFGTRCYSGCVRDLGTAYLLCLAQFFGFAGLHRYYLGKPVTGTLWLFTWGLFGIGLLYDLITLPAQVEAVNKRLLASGYRPYGYLPPGSVYVHNSGHGYGYAGQPYQPPGYQPPGYPGYQQQAGYQQPGYQQPGYQQPGYQPRPQGYAQPQPQQPAPVERQIIDLARRNGGQLTAIAAAGALNLSVEETEQHLDHLTTHGHANIEVSEQGVVYYDFPGLRV